MPQIQRVRILKFSESEHIAKPSQCWSSCQLRLAEEMDKIARCRICTQWYAVIAGVHACACAHVTHINTSLQTLHSLMGLQEGIPKSHFDAYTREVMLRSDGDQDGVLSLAEVSSGVWSDEVGGIGLRRLKTLSLSNPRSEQPL